MSNSLRSSALATDFSYTRIGMSKRILGLDMGTNSIGWAVVVDQGGGKFDLIKRGVHIFPEGVKVEKGVESSKAAERTGFRSARRLKFRRKLRKIKALRVLSEHGFCPPLSEEDLKNWQSRKTYPQNEAFRRWCKTTDPVDDAQTCQNPYYYRWLAATKKLDLSDANECYKIGRAFYHMAQRRGFKSNRLDTTQESDGEVSKSINALSERMNGRTLGAYFWEACYCKGEKIRNVHTSREEHYEAEFDVICEMQGIPDNIKDELRKAIFHQRPLKSHKGLVASCVLEPGKKRAPISHPLFEEFRMWQTLNNIKIKTEADAQLRFLTDEEKEQIIPRFFRVNRHFDFKDIAKALTPKKLKHAYYRSEEAADAHVLFNYRDDQSLAGCPLSARLKNIFGEEYKQAIYDAYQGTLIQKDGAEKTVEDILHEVWHVLFSFDDAAKLKQFAQKRLGLSGEQAKSFSKIPTPQGYGALSLKALGKILPFLQQGHIYSHAVSFANLDGVLEDSDADLEQVKTDIARLVDSYSRFKAETLCVNQFVHEYRESPQQFLERHDLKRVDAFAEKLDVSLQESAETICRTLRGQLCKNNDNGEFLELVPLHERIQNHLIEAYGVEPGKAAKIYHPSAMEAYKPPSKNEDGKHYLGDPRISSVRNPVFMRAMYRLKAVVNELLKQGVITEQTQVHVEMARELNDANKRAAIRTWQRNRETLRSKYRKTIEKQLKEQGSQRRATDDEILKYQLWEEQGKQCPYCDEKINLSTLLSEQCEIEHTIPRSRCCDNSQENKTVAHRDCNRAKGNRIPAECADHETILRRVDLWRKKKEKLTREIDKQRPRSRHAATKEAKDKAIQKRLVLEFERDYYREKYHRFTMKEVKAGFKNSQLVDTRIITRYALQYLKTVFDRVFTVNGKLTDDFRRCWGINKSRDTHAHHAVDAVVAACVTRAQYDRLAAYYHNYENHHHNTPSAPKKPHFPKPWETFTEDMKILQDEIHIAHHRPNHLLKQTKRRSKINKQNIVQQGHSSRGSLHKETFYGAIKTAGTNKKGEHEEIIKYVVRKPVNQLSAADLKNIVDDRVRSIVSDAFITEGRIKKEIESLQKKKATATDAGELLICEQIEELESQLINLYTLPNKNGSPIPIRKVRVYAKVTNPIALKAQRDLNPSKPHKHHFRVTPDDSFAIALFEGVTSSGKTKRSHEVYNAFNASRRGTQLPDHQSSKQVGDALLHFKQSYRVGDTVLMLEHEGQRPIDSTQHLYTIFGIEGDGRIKLRFHTEARKDEEQGKENSAFDSTAPSAKLRVRPSKFHALKEGVDFRLNVLGEIEYMKE